MLSALIFVACLVTEVVPREIDYCFANEGDPYIWTAAKTPYRFARGGSENPEIVPNCKPVQIWLLSRHGTRLPSKEEIAGMQTLPALRDTIIRNHNEGRGRLCDLDLENLRQWTFNQNMTKDRAKYLTEEGEMDLGQLGGRLRMNYPELLQPRPEDVTPRNYKFRSTDTERTIKSMTSFIKGVFGSPSAVNFTEVVPVENDTLLRAYKTCTPWLEMIRSQPVLKEVNELMNGMEYAQMRAHVSRRLGFQSNLTLDDINLLYQACRFENAFLAYKLKLSPWCAVFNQDEMRLLEYEEDLYYYYYSGHGKDMSKHVGCMPLQDLYNRFEALETSNSTDQLKGVFYFSHATLIQFFYVSMGLHRDPQPLKAANFRTMDDRLWRTSKISAFAANVAAVFYKCNPAAGSKHKVVFRGLEKNLFLEDCENGVCDWEWMKNRVRSAALNCNLDFCKSGAATQLGSLIATPFLSISVILFAGWRSA